MYDANIMQKQQQIKNKKLYKKGQIQNKVHSKFLTGLVCSRHFYGM